MGDKADINKDKITVNDKQLIVNRHKNFVYYIINKPKGYICSNVKQKKTDKLVIDLVPKEYKVWVVGRLDKNSLGLVMLTNDGELTQKYSHPKFEHEKEYEVVVNGEVSEEFLKQMKKGIMLDEGLAKADKIKKISNRSFNIILHQGWKRQIRRMCGELGMGVIGLKRIRIGDIKLGNLKEGEYKLISKL